MGRARKNSIASVNYACEFPINHSLVESEAWLYLIRDHTGIVADASTCRCHCESKHAVTSTCFLSLRLLTYNYCRNWCKKVGFESKLAGDVAARKLKAEQSQRTIDGHLVEKKLADRTVAYSDKLF